MMEKMNPVVTALRDDIRRRQQVVQHIASLEEQLDSDRICGAWLAAHDAGLQCVVSECVSHGRRTGFGRAQSPALTDYPDDRDVLAWLAALD